MMTEQQSVIPTWYLNIAGDWNLDDAYGHLATIECGQTWSTDDLKRRGITPPSTPYWVLLTRDQRTPEPWELRSYSVQLISVAVGQLYLANPATFLMEFVL